MINECDIYAVSYFYLFFNVGFLILFCAAACVSQNAPAQEILMSLWLSWSIKVN